MILRKYAITVEMRDLRSVVRRQLGSEDDVLNGMVPQAMWVVYDLEVCLRPA